MSMTDPVSERLAQNVLAALKNVVTPAYAVTLVNPHRPNPAENERSPPDMGCTLWQHQVRPDKPTSSPFGQAEWSHVFEAAVWLKPSATSTVPVGRRINITRAEVERALMVDRRRGGLCYVDNRILDPVLTEDPESKTLGVRVMLLCQYRTLATDPRVPAPTAGNELLFSGGATLYLAPLTGGYAVGPWRAYADVRVTPRVTPTVDRINTDAGGQSRPAHLLYAGHVIEYVVDVPYLNGDVVARQLGGTALPDAVQAAGVHAAVPHVVAGPDSVLPLVDGHPVYGVTAVTSVTAGGTTYAVGRDYVADPDQLAAGSLLIPAGSTIPADATVAVTFTTAGQSRSATAAGTACTADVRARIVWSASNGDQLVHDDPANVGFDASLVATSATANPGEPAASSLMLTVRDNGSATPLGRYLLPAGPRPAAVGY